MSVLLAVCGVLGLRYPYRPSLSYGSPATFCILRAWSHLTVYTAGDSAIVVAEEDIIEERSGQSGSSGADGLSAGSGGRGWEGWDGKWEESGWSLAGVWNNGGWWGEGSGGTGEIVGIKEIGGRKGTGGIRWIGSGVSGGSSLAGARDRRDGREGRDGRDGRDGREGSAGGGGRYNGGDYPPISAVPGDEPGVLSIVRMSLMGMFGPLDTALLYYCSPALSYVALYSILPHKVRTVRCEHL